LWIEKTNKEGKLHFVGSDGYRLALYMHEGIHLKEDILFSRNSLKVLEKLLKETLGEVVANSCHFPFKSVKS